jgi:hypothetical protein
VDFIGSLFWTKSNCVSPISEELKKTALRVDLTGEDLEQTAKYYLEKTMHGNDFAEDQITDLAATGDTAGAAACAYAYDNARQKIDPARFAEFWRWWLTEAFVYAYEHANHEPD